MSNAESNPEMEELFGSDSDKESDKEEKPKTKTDEMEELFGEESEDDTTQKKSPDGDLSPKEIEKMKSSEKNDVFGSDDDEEEEVDITSRLAHSSRPEYNDVFGSDDDDEDGGGTSFMDTAKEVAKKPEHSILSIPETKRLPDESNMILKMPKFVQIQTAPFSKETFDPESERAQYSTATSMLRWRYKRDAAGEIERDANGVPVRESNSRLVKYSDGSFQLIVGEEIFDCNFLPVRDSFVFCHRKSAPQENLATDDPETAAAGVKQETCLECVGQIDSKIHLQPSGVDSKSHELMALRANEKHRKASRLKSRDTVIMGNINPEKELDVRIAAVNEEIKRERKRQQRDEGPKQRMYGRMPRGEGPSMRASYLQEGFEDDSMYDSISVRDIKKKVASRPRQYDSEGEEEEDELDDDGEDMNDFIVKDDDDEDGGEEGAWNESDDGDYNGSGDESAKKALQSKKKEKKREKTVPNNDDDPDAESSPKSAKKETASKRPIENDDDDEDDEAIVGHKLDKSSSAKRARKTIIDSDDEDED